MFSLFFPVLYIFVVIVLGAVLVPLVFCGARRARAWRRVRGFRARRTGQGAAV